MVEKSLMLKKLGLLDGSLSRLMKFSEGKGFGRKRDMSAENEVRSAFDSAVQICVDVAGDMIFACGWPAAKNKVDAIGRLRENDVIDDRLCRSLSAMVKISSIMACYPDKAGPEILEKVLRENLEDVTLFRGAIIDRLKTLA
jgi:uncharacterized protein YutE (UPF0331/DUF86 family)